MTRSFWIPPGEITSTFFTYLIFYPSTLSKGDYRRCPTTLPLPLPNLRRNFIYLLIYFCSVFSLVLFSVSMKSLTSQKYYRGQKCRRTQDRSSVNSWTFPSLTVVVSRPPNGPPTTHRLFTFPVPGSSESPVSRAYFTPPGLLLCTRKSRTLVHVPHSNFTSPPLQYFQYSQCFRVLKTPQTYSTNLPFP